MAKVISFHLSPTISVKAKHYKINSEGSPQVRGRKFTLNSEHASFEFLRLLLARTFDITGEFIINYKTKEDTYLPISSDWDFDVALSDVSESSLNLTIKHQPLEDIYKDWDVIGPSDLAKIGYDVKFRRHLDGSSLDSILSRMKNTIAKMSRALSLTDCSPEGDFAKLPMTQFEFSNLMDCDGRLVRPHQLHLTVFQGGVEPNLRPVVWKHLLNIFPYGMTEKEREDYLEVKSEEYFRLRYSWQKQLNEGEASEELKNVTNLVKKDVRRTDRSHKFYGGSDDNKNVQALFNVLTTYAITHPRVSYCQGMSDMLSPLLYVMKNEAHAYICFCGLFKRVEANFRPDGRSIKMKFRHLRRMLFYYDRELFLFLNGHFASNLLFCYRWLLLELKREFVYSDALHMMEVLWGSLPPKPPKRELNLCESSYESKLINESYSNVQRNDLVWVTDYYSCSHSLRHVDTGISANLVSHRETQAIEIPTTDNSIEIQLPIHYRKRKYRSYTARKLIRISSDFTDSIASKRNSFLSIKTQDNDHLNICQSWACGEDFENFPLEINSAVLSAREFLRTQWCYSNTVNEIQLNNWLSGRRWNTEDGGTAEKDNIQSVLDGLRRRHGSSDSNYTMNSEEILCESGAHESKAKAHSNLMKKSRSEGYESDITESSESEAEDAYDTDNDSIEDDDEFMQYCPLDSMAGKKYMEATSYFHRKKEMLPKPNELGDGNPFLMFLCVAMILQQRDEILGKNMDENDLCIFFDKLVRKHKLSKILTKGRTMFREYLNMGWNDDENDSDGFV